MSCAPQVRQHLDSTIALYLVKTAGLAKAKHVEFQHLWIQEDAVKSWRILAHKAHTDWNPADLMSTSVYEEKCAACVRNRMAL